MNKHDIKLYLQKFEPEALESMINSKKSTKKLEGGPMVYDKKSPLGKPRRGFSIPADLRNNTTFEFGVSSYKKGVHSQLKEVLANQFTKDEMVEKLNEKFISEMSKKVKAKRDWRTRAF